MLMQRNLTSPYDRQRSNKRIACRNMHVRERYKYPEKNLYCNFLLRILKRHWIKFQKR